MADKKVNRIILKNSSVVTDGVPKLPGTDQLEFGEIAVNYGAGGETISIKNSDEKIVEFKSKDYFESIIEENELIVANALTNLDNRVSSVQEIAENTKNSLNENNAYTSNILSDLGNKVNELGELKTVVEDNEYITTKAIVNLDERINELDDTTNSIKTNVRNHEISTSNAISNLGKQIGALNSDVSSIEQQINTLNSDVSSIEQQIDTLNGDVSSIEQQIADLGETVNDNEFVIANALNDLNERLESIDGTGGSSISVENLTYSELSEKILSSTLVPGSKYRITDYVTMCVDSYQYNSTTTVFIKSANHPFDIIVEALSENTLSEDAKAIQREGDTYFTGNNLDAWELKYCFDNDTSRFSWVDSSCKGVIYYMKDEFNNEVWYDFKNIMFQRSSEWFIDYQKFTSASAITQDTYFYTFSIIDGVNIKDDSLYSTNFHATDNHLGRNTAKITKLNNTIFIDKPNNGVFNNIIGDGHANNTFGQSVWNNRIGHNCLNNIINKQFQYNDITSNFSSNHSWGSFAYNNVESGCVGNRFLGNVTKCTFKQAYSSNNFTGDTLSNCTFGANIKYVSDMPSMSNVTFDNDVINSNSSVYLNNLMLDNGQNMLNALSSLHSNTTNIIVSKYNNKYRLVNITNNDDLLDCVYDLGSFSSNGDGENAAYNINLIRNPKILFLRFFNTSTNKYVYIKQITNNINCGVGEWGCTKQYIYLDGRVDVRKCWFQNVLGSYQTATDNNHITSWTHLEDANGYLYSNGNKIVTNEQKSIKQTINATDSNNANIGGYYGKISNLSIKGSNINFEKISVYRRNGTGIGNSDVFCKILVKNNNQWDLVYKSNNKINVSSKSPGNECTFNMVPVENAHSLSSNDTIAIIFSNNETAAPAHLINMGLKTVSGISGGINIGSTENSTYLPSIPNIQSFSPAMSIVYTSINDIEYVSLSKDEDINGIKTFNNGINVNGINVKGDIVITDSDGDKTVIKNAIDKGELKVFSGTSSNGFIIKPNGLSTHSIPKLELLATNNNESYKYKLSQLSGGNNTSNVLLSTYVDNSFTSTDPTNGVYCVQINDNNGFSYVNLSPIQGGSNITSSNTNLVQGKAVYEYAAPKSHTHTISNVSGLQTALNGKQAKISLSTGLNFSGDELELKIGTGLRYTVNTGATNYLELNYGAGLTTYNSSSNGGDFSKGIKVNVDNSTIGIQSGGGLYVKYGYGLTDLAGEGLSIHIGSGIQNNGSGLEFDSVNKGIQVKYSSSGGLKCTTYGLSIKAGDYLYTDNNGLQLSIGSIVQAVKANWNNYN